MQIGEFRKQYPEYDDKTDMELATAFHTKYYNEVEFDTFLDKFGVTRELAYDGPDLELGQGREQETVGLVPVEEEVIEAVEETPYLLDGAADISAKDSALAFGSGIAGTIGGASADISRRIEPAPDEEVGPVEEVWDSFARGVSDFTGFAGAVLKGSAGMAQEALSPAAKKANSDFMEGKGVDGLTLHSFVQTAMQGLGSVGAIAPTFLMNPVVGMAATGAIFGPTMSDEAYVSTYHEFSRLSKEDLMANGGFGVYLKNANGDFESAKDQYANDIATMRADIQGTVGALSGAAYRVIGAAAGGKLFKFKPANVAAGGLLEAVQEAGENLPGDIFLNKELPEAKLDVVDNAIKNAVGGLGAGLALSTPVAVMQTASEVVQSVRGDMTVGMNRKEVKEEAKARGISLRDEGKVKPVEQLRQEINRDYTLTSSPIVVDNEGLPYDADSRVEKQNQITAAAEAAVVEEGNLTATVEADLAVVDLANEAAMSGEVDVNLAPDVVENTKDVTPIDIPNKDTAMDEMLDPVEDVLVVAPEAKLTSTELREQAADELLQNTLKQKEAKVQDALAASDVNPTDINTWDNAVAALQEEKAAKNAILIAKAEKEEAAALAVEQAKAEEEQAVAAKKEEGVKKVDKRTEARLARNQEKLDKQEAERIKDEAFVEFNEGRRKVEGTVLSYDKEKNTYDIQTMVLDKDTDSFVVGPVKKGLPAKRVRALKDKASKKMDVAEEGMDSRIAAAKAKEKEVEDLFNLAMGRTSQQEEVAIEVPVVPPKAEPEYTPDASIPTASKYLEKTDWWKYDGEGIFIDEMDNIQEPSERNLTRILAHRGIDIDGNPVKRDKAGKKKPAISVEDEALAKQVSASETATSEVEVKTTTTTQANEDVDIGVAEDVEAKAEDIQGVDLQEEKDTKESERTKTSDPIPDRVVKDETLDDMTDRLNRGEPIRDKAHALEILENAYGVSFANVPIDWNPGRGRKKAVQGTYAPNGKGTGQLTIYYNQVTQGQLAELMLHEKAIHEMIFDNPKFKREKEAVLERIEVLLSEGNKEVMEARAIAKDAVLGKHFVNEVSVARLAYDRQANIQDEIAEETIAYLMNQGKNRGWFRRMLSLVKTIYDDFFNTNLTPDQLRQLVRGMLQTEVNKLNENIEAVNQQAGEVVVTEDEFTMDDFLAAQNEQAADMESVEVREAVEEDVDGTQEEEYVAQLATAPQNILFRAFDATMSKAHAARGMALKFFPAPEILERGVNQGMKALGLLSNLNDKQRAYAHNLMDQAQGEVLEPLVRFQHSDPEGYAALKTMMNNATMNNKSPKGSMAWNRMSPEAHNVYEAVEAYFKKQGREYIGALTTQIGQMPITSTQRASFMNMVDQFKANINDRVYFPMQRFGKYKLEAVMPNGERYVSFSDHPTELLKEASQMRKDGWTVGKQSLVQEFGEDAKKLIDPAMLSNAKDLVEGLGGDQVAKDALWKAFLQMAPSSRLKERMSKRKFVAGSSTDLTRGVATSINFFQDIAKRRFSAVRSSILEKAEEQLNELPGTSTKEDKARIAANQTWAQVRTNEELSGKGRAAWSSTATKFNFIMNLGFNPSSAMVNLTQNVIVGLPILGSEYGMTSASMEMTKALVDVVAGMNKAGSIFKGRELDAYNAWKKTGKLDDTQAMMHNNLSEGLSDSYNSSFDTAVEWSAYMFHNAEITNRMVAGLTAYRLEMRKSGDHTLAVTKSGKAINDIHFNYSEEGKSQMQRTDIGSVALAFKSYPVQMMFYMAKNIKKTFKGATPEVKRKAFGQFVGTMSITAMLGGAVALPMYSALLLAVDMLYDDDDEDAHTDLVEWSKESFGEDGSQVFLNGLGSYLTDTNLTSRVSLDNMMLRVPAGGGDPGQWGDALATAAVGPVGSRVLGIKKGIDLMYDGYVMQGMEKLMPAFMTNASKAIRWGVEGEAHGTYDNLIEEDFDEIDTLRKAIGFSSLEYSDANRDYWDTKRTTRNVKEAKKKLMRSAANTYLYGDTQDKAELRDKLAIFNEGKPREDKIRMRDVRKRSKILAKKRGGEE